MLNLRLKLAKNCSNNLMEPTCPKPELDLHMHLTLKIAYNLKSLTMNQNVRKFFFSRFKRQLVQKNIIDSVLTELRSNIEDTQVRIRDREFCLFRFCYEITEAGWFKAVITLAVFANSLTLAMSKYPIDLDYEWRLELSNLIFFGLFCLELILKLVGRGVEFYLSDHFNWFDGGVILISAVDVSLQYTLKRDYDSGSITALRVLRLIRVIRLAKIFRDFNQLFSAIRNTLKDISNISILLTIFILTYALLGLELFAFRVESATPSQGSIYP